MLIFFNFWLKESNILAYNLFLYLHLVKCNLIKPTYQLALGEFLGSMKFSTEMLAAQYKYSASHMYNVQLSSSHIKNK